MRCALQLIFPFFYEYPLAAGPVEQGQLLSILGNPLAPLAAAPLARIFYLFPFARLCVLQSISQFSGSVLPPLLQAVTWSASISDSL